MRLLCITDLHGEGRSLSAILSHAGPIDRILLGGDLTNFGTPNQAEKLVAIAQDACPQLFAVAGNCDSAAIDERLTELDVSLFRRGVVQDGVGFYGVSAMPPWMGTMYELSEEAIAESLALGREQIGEVPRHVVLSHTPPRDCQLDRTSRGEHVGSAAVRAMIESCRPALVVCGHIHEGRGVELLGSTTVVNCGTAFKGNYALAQIDADGKVNVELRNVECDA